MAEYSYMVVPTNGRPLTWRGVAEYYYNKNKSCGAKDNKSDSMLAVLPSASSDAAVKLPTSGTKKIEIAGKYVLTPEEYNKRLAVEITLVNLETAFVAVNEEGKTPEEVVPPLAERIAMGLLFYKEEGRYPILSALGDGNYEIVRIPKDAIDIVCPKVEQKPRTSPQVAPPTGSDKKTDGAKTDPTPKPSSTGRRTGTGEIRSGASGRNSATEGSGSSMPMPSQ